jgi:hypothetical protein
MIANGGVFGNRAASRAFASFPVWSMDRADEFFNALGFFLISFPSCTASKRVGRPRHSALSFNSRFPPMDYSFCPFSFLMLYLHTGGQSGGQDYTGSSTRFHVISFFSPPVSSTASNFLRSLAHSNIRNTPHGRSNLFWVFQGMGWAGD